jgi:hypothetical protein
MVPSHSLARCASQLLSHVYVQTRQQKASLEMLELLKELRKKVAIGFLGGSDLVKITDQLTVTGNNRKCKLPASHSSKGV